MNINSPCVVSDVDRGFDLWRDPKWTQDEYIIQHRDPLVLEPRSGWAITTDGSLIPHSLGFGHALYVRKPNYFSFKARRRVRKLDRIAVSFRDTGEENYFHFFNDVLGKLFLLEQHNFDLSAYPLIISRSLFDKLTLSTLSTTAAFIN